MAYCDESIGGHRYSFGVKKEEDDDDDMELEVDIKGIVKEEVEIFNPGEAASEDSSHTDGKVCSVCNRSAKSSHFGALCCDSCRAFFRRSVQNSVWETFICFKGGCCDIVKNRRSCQCCRFKRCLAAGMDKSLVMTEEDRKALMYRKIERRRQIVLEHQRLGGPSQEICFDAQQEPDNVNQTDDREDCGRHLTEDEVIANKCRIEYLQKVLRKCLSFPEFPELCREGDPDVMENLFIVFCKNIGRFFGSVPEFRELEPTYQGILLKPAVAKAIFILGSHQYEPSSNSWPRIHWTPSCRFPTITMSTMKNFIDDDVTMMKWKDFIEKFRLFFMDEVATLLTLVVSLFDYKDSSLGEIPDISHRKEIYLKLYRFYLQSNKCQASDTTAYLSYLKSSLLYIEELKECFQNSTTEENRSGAHSNDSIYECSPSSSSTGGYSIPVKSDPLVQESADGFSFHPAVSTEAEDHLSNAGGSTTLMPLSVKDENEYKFFDYLSL
ncbi:thyroid hormone receptor alpha-like isoform X2 [Palaemon carinicauda]